MHMSSDTRKQIYHQKHSFAMAHLAHNDIHALLSYSCYFPLTLSLTDSINSFTVSAIKYSLVSRSVPRFIKISQSV